MKYIKSFENKEVTKYDEKFLIGELLTENVDGRVNLYAGIIHLMKTEYSEYLPIKVRAIEPETSALFHLYATNEDKIYTTEYGFVYKILYMTNDKDDAIYNYEIYANVKKYNL